MQTGHSLPVAQAAFSPDGRLAATAGRDGEAALWDARAGWKLRALTADALGATAVAFSRDGRRLLVGGAGVVSLRDAGSGRLLKRFGEPGEFVHWTSFSRDEKLVLAAGDDDAVKAWDVSTGRLMQLYRTDGARRLSSAALSPDGSKLAAADGTETIWLWDFRDARALKPLTGGGRWRSVAFFPDGARLAAGGDEWAAVWSLAEGVESARMKTPASRAVAVSPDGRHVATSGGSTARLWSAEGAEEGSFIGHSDAVNSLAFSADGRRLLTASDDRSALVWDAASRRPLARLGRQAVKPLFAAFTARGLLTLDAGELRLWDARTGRPKRAAPGDWEGVSGFCASPDGRYAAGLRENGGIVVGDLEGKVSTGPWTRARASAAALDARGALYAAEDGRVEAWDLALGRELPLPLPRVDARQLLPAQDGSRLVTVDGRGEVAAWDLADGRRTAAFRAGDSLRPVVMLARDARAAAAAGMGRSDTGGARFVLTARSLDDGRELASWETEAELRPLAFASDGAALLTRSDSELALWDLDARRKLTASALDPADALDWPAAVDAARGLAAAARQDELALVSLRTGAEAARLLMLEGGGWLLSSPDGRLDGGGDAARWSDGAGKSRPLSRSPRYRARLLADVTGP